MLILILILLQYWVNIPTWAVWMFISLWIIMDVILYPFIWRAYEKSNSTSMIGLKGTAVDHLAPSGHVRIKGELWRAKVTQSNSTIQKGEIVTVKRLDGLTLIVQSEKKEHA